MEEVRATKKRCKASESFKYLYRTADRKQHYTVCRFCLAANTPRKKTPKIMKSCPRSFARHLKGCPYHIGRLRETPPSTPSCWQVLKRLKWTPAMQTPSSDPRVHGGEADTTPDASGIVRTINFDQVSSPPSLTENEAFTTPQREHNTLQSSTEAAMPAYQTADPVGSYTVGEDSADRQSRQHQPTTRSACRHVADPKVWSRHDVDEFHRLLVVYQHTQRLPDSYIEKRATLDLYEFLRPGITQRMVKRRTLGTTLLTRVAMATRTETEQSLKSQQTKYRGRVNLLSDVWQNVQKAHLLAIQLSLFGILYTFAVAAVGSTHTGVTIARDLEVQIEAVIKVGWVIGAIITDNAGQCARARRILALRWTNVVFLHCFAHDINNLVKAVLNSAFRGTYTTAGAVVNTLNGSSSKWLVRARTATASKYGKALSFFTLCETRWNSMQACFASLLRVKSGLIAFHKQWSDDPEFPASLNVLGDPGFWSELEKAESIIRPLSFASYKLQRDENTLADVVHCYGFIYREFAKSDDNRDKIVECVEKRWAACEQPLFVLGFFLHPAYFARAQAMPVTLLTDNKNLQQFAVYYYRRLLESEPTTLADDFMAWRAGELSSVRWTTSKACCDYWREVRSDLESRGHPTELPDLAITVLSIAVNTATCERLFSELGLIHTTIRNKMSSLKALLIHWVRQFYRSESNDSDVKIYAKRIVNPNERSFCELEVADADLPLEALDVSEDIASVSRDPDGHFFENYVDEIMVDEELEFGYAVLLHEEASIPTAHRTSNLVIDGREEIKRSDRRAGISDKSQQESKLTGLRSAKVSLATMHSTRS